MKNINCVNIISTSIIFEVVHVKIHYTVTKNISGEILQLEGFYDRKQFVKHSPISKM